MSIYSTYQSDIKLENEGIWHELGDGVSVKVAAIGANNKALVALREKLERPHKYRLDKGTLSDEIANEIHIRLIAHTVLIGWKNIQDRAGKDIEYSPDAAYEILSDKSMDAFLACIIKLGTDEELFKIGEKAERIKNLKKPSGGS